QVQLLPRPGESLVESALPPRVTAAVDSVGEVEADERRLRVGECVPAEERAATGRADFDYDPGLGIRNETAEAHQLRLHLERPDESVGDGPGKIHDGLGLRGGARCGAEIGEGTTLGEVNAEL